MKQFRFLFSVLLGSLLLISFSQSSFAASKVQLIIDSQTIKTDSPPETLNGYTMVSLSSLKPLGLNLQWDPKTKTVIAISTKSKEKLTLSVGKKTATMGNQTVTLQSPPVLRNNRVLVPLRFISEAFDSQVFWNKDENSVVIRSSDKIADYKTLYESKDLVQARKIAVDLPTSDTNTLTETGEAVTYAYHFPEGEALRYYFYQGSLVSYYEIKNDVKHLVWEAVLSEDGSYVKENGKRPTKDKAQVYFAKHRIDDGVDYGRLGDSQPLVGEVKGGPLSGIIMAIPNEVRKDK
ncbi:copper amine oxidase N-terminal domain-containing protein [Paenibacillus enshidis]|uniref:Copper amine oxidase N-terminal domain-containing protein n=1 Tax=Paenibacillus enshidis TaxID=1458439 RepID=A0ABV5AZI1_9BACL